MVAVRKVPRLPGAAIAAIAASIGLAAPAHAASASPPQCTVTLASDADVAARSGFADVRPGSTVCIAPGVYRNVLAIGGVHAPPDAPVTFLVSPATGVARFVSGVLLRATSGVTVAGLDVTRDPRLGPGASVTIDVGSRDNVVRNLVVHDAYVGISIGSSEGPAGPGNQVVDNVVRDSWNTGIAVGEFSDGLPNAANLIARNRVSGSGGHGIEINDSNDVAVRDNVVTSSGTGVNSVRQGGYSGIHLYASGPTTPASPHGIRTARDVVSGNRVEGTRERPTDQHCDDGSGSGVCADGNGIQVDRYASSNQVVANTVTGNAGAGISIYGAANNLIQGNVVSGNNLQVGRRRYFPGPAEIAVSAVNLPFGSTSGNMVTGNTATTTVHRIPAFYLSDNAGPNRIAADNTWRRDPRSGPDFLWAEVYVGKSWYSPEKALRAFAALAK